MDDGKTIDFAAKAAAREIAATTGASSLSSAAQDAAMLERLALVPKYRAPDTQAAHELPTQGRYSRTATLTSTPMIP